MRRETRAHLSDVFCLPARLFTLRVGRVCPDQGERCESGLVGGQAERVHCVAEELDEMSPDDIPGVQAAFADLVALKRYAEPSEIAEVVAFLASDKASYVTGSIYTIDAGMTGM